MSKDNAKEEKKVLTLDEKIQSVQSQLLEANNVTNQLQGALSTLMQLKEEENG